MNLINIFPDPSKLIDIENTNKIVLFIFLKITDNSIKENIKNDFLKENINILHWFDCQYTNIGKEDFWSDALIIEFKNKNNLQEIYKSDIGRVLQNLENRNSNLLPTKKQAERILKEKSNKKAFMINLLQSRKTAKYKDRSISISGREAYYEKYGKTATKCVLLLGGDVTYSGRVLGDTLIEYNVPLDTTGNWEAIGIIEYPKAVKMLDLEKMPGYSKALLHREAGLEKTYNLYATKN